MNQAQENPLVSIITINWNSVEHTLAMLESLSHATYPRIETIVVDNASSGDDASQIEAAFPDVKLIRNDRNEGFTGGNNTGIRVCRGDYVMLLNNDTIVEPDFLEPLVRVVETNRSAGIVSPKILFFSPAQTIQYAGSTPINFLTVRGSSFGYGERDQGQCDRAGRTGLPHGAAMLIRRSVLDDIGLLWDPYFVYYEEYDFAERAKRAGYEIFFEPDSVIHHKQSASIGKSNPFKTYLMTRNRLLFLRRNATGVRLLVGLGFFSLFAFPKALITNLLRGQFVLLFATVRGVVWHLCNPRLGSETILIQNVPG